MNEAQITKGIARARRGIGQYLEIMRLFARTNVAENRYFQTKYNAFYKVRQRSSNWYDEYYRHMEEMRGQEVSFSSILRHFQRRLGKYEPSFSSKLLATLNTSFPVWTSMSSVISDFKPQLIRHQTDTKKPNQLTWQSKVGIKAFSAR